MSVFGRARHGTLRLGLAPINKIDQRANRTAFRTKGHLTIYLPLSTTGQESATDRPPPRHATLRPASPSSAIMECETLPATKVHNRLIAVQGSLAAALCSSSRITFCLRQKVAEGRHVFRLGVDGGVGSIATGYRDLSRVNPHSLTCGFSPQVLAAPPR